MKNILIVVNTIKDENLSIAGSLQKYLQEKGAAAEVIRDAENIPADVNAEGIVVLGGDGTMLAVSGCLKDKDIPMIGVNLGTVGYMTEIDPEEMFPAMDRLLADDYRVEERLNLEGIIYRGDKEVMRDVALNDIVIARSGFSRIICFRIFVNGELLDVYEADGVILSTPTGSTAYNLSAGGPIVSPNTDLIVITPVSPHSLTSKSVIVSAKDRIEIELVPKRKSQSEEATATYDGRGVCKLETKDRIVIGSAPKKTRLMKLTNMGFYERLRSRLSQPWGGSL